MNKKVAKKSNKLNKSLVKDIKEQILKDLTNPLNQRNLKKSMTINGKKAFDIANSWNDSDFNTLSINDLSSLARYGIKYKDYLKIENDIIEEKESSKNKIIAKKIKSLGKIENEEDLVYIANLIQNYEDIYEPGYGLSGFKKLNSYLTTGEAGHVSDNDVLDSLINEVLNHCSESNNFKLLNWLYKQKKDNPLNQYVNPNASTNNHPLIYRFLENNEANILELVKDCLKKSNHNSGEVLAKPVNDCLVKYAFYSYNFELLSGIDAEKSIKTLLKIIKKESVDNNLKINKKSVEFSKKLIESKLLQVNHAENLFCSALMDTAVKSNFDNKDSLLDLFTFLFEKTPNSIITERQSLVSIFSIDNRIIELFKNTNQKLFNEVAYDSALHCYFNLNNKSLKNHETLNLMVKSISEDYLIEKISGIIKEGDLCVAERFIRFIDEEKAQKIIPEAISQFIANESPEISAIYTKYLINISINNEDKKSQNKKLKI